MAEQTERSLQMLATALEKEERGRDFYLKASTTCANFLGKDIFRVLATEEGIHITRCREIYESLRGGRAWTDDWRKHKQENENLQALFRKRMTELGPKVTTETGDLDALAIGLEFEQGAIRFYEDELLNATDRLEKDFIECMILEERVHYASLADMKHYLTNPESWFTEKEHHVLDGA